MQQMLKHTSVIHYFFTERIVNAWNSLPDEVDFSTVKSFTGTIKGVSFSNFVSYFDNMIFNALFIICKCTSQAAH